MTLLKVFGPLICLLFLTSCRSTILHQDGARAAITDPLIEALDRQTDKLHIEELVVSSTKAIDRLTVLIDEIKQSAEVSQDVLKEVSKSIDKVTELTVALKETSEASTELIRTANESLKEAKLLLPEFKKIAESTNSILPEIKEMVGNLNGAIKKVTDDVRTTTNDSLFIKLLPTLVLAVAILLAIFIIVKVFKKYAS